MGTLLPTSTFLPLLTQIWAASLSPSVNVRIVGGQDATIDQYPYQVSLHVNDYFHCGGSILNEFYVLTAAHCLDERPDRMTIRAGSSFVHHGGITRNVVKKFIHPNYNSATVDNDIGILKLDEPLIFNRNISIIELPQQNANSNSADGLIGVTTGWGRSSEYPKYPEQLQMVIVPTVPQFICQYDFANLPLIITNAMLCAGFNEGGRDPCIGDSGGPLVADGVIIGITSWGYGCARPNFPAVFTRVSYFVDYIKSIISK